MTDRQEPQTAAGRALIHSMRGLAASFPSEIGGEPIASLDVDASLGVILAIEAEARAAALPTVEAVQRYASGLEAIRDTSTDPDSRRLADSMLHALAIGAWGE